MNIEYTGTQQTIIKDNNKLVNLLYGLRVKFIGYLRKLMVYLGYLICLFIVGGVISIIVHSIEKTALLKNNCYIIRELRKERRYEEAFFMIERLAEQGNKGAQFELGSMYENPTYNEPVQRDIVQAFKWYRLAAVQGNIKAQYALGRIYFTQIHNYKEAFVWFEKAAKQKYPAAMVWLADMYNDGLGTEKNHQKSIYWHVCAAYGKFIADAFFK